MSGKRPYPRRELWRLFNEWCRQNARALSVVMVGYLLLAAFLLSGAVVLDRPGNSLLLGFVIGILVLIVPFFLTLAFLVNHAQAIHQLRGAWGEDNTRDLLRKARRRRLVWGSVHGIALGQGDIDHLVATRTAGIVAIDSKWRSAVGRKDPAALAQQARRMKTRAEALVGTVLQAEKGRHRGRPEKIDVTPVVVLWGAAQHGVPDGIRIDGVAFVPGQNLVQWLASLKGTPLEKDVAKHLLRSLKTFDKNRATFQNTKAARVPV